ncbi:MAG: formylglycine-generating enzyme family protein [Pirellulaceae bacterium]|nr:formylglycine-generating enzyme family protein [Pirellulaceae bacterium]
MIDQSPLPEKLESPETPTVGQESIVSFPIEVFLDRLTRQHGWDVSVRDRLRIAHVLQADGAWTTARLQQILGSLLARSSEEHLVFENHFRDFFGPPTNARSLRSLPWDLERLRLDLERLVERIAAEYDRRLVPPFPIAEHRDQTSPPPQKEKQAGYSAAATRSEDLQPLPPPALVRWMEIPWPERVGSEAARTKTTELDLLSFAHREGSADQRVFFLSDVAEPGPMLAIELLDHLADSMSYFPSHRPSRQLDLSATVDRTIANRCPTVCFLPKREVCHLLILEDLYAEDRAWNRVAGEFAVGMSQRGIPVTRGFFYGNPMRFRLADGSGGCDLEDWEDLRDGVLALLFTDGSGLSAAAAPRVLDELQQWPRLAWMDLRDETFWDGATLRAVRLRMSVFPASAEGLLRMSQAFFTEQGRTVSQSRLPSPGEPHASLEGRLRVTLQSAVPWAQTCSCLPSIPAGLADALRRRFHPETPATAIGRLYALSDKPDDTAGLQLPEPVRAALFAGFCASRSDAQQAEVIAFLRSLIGDKVQQLASGSLARQSGETLLMRLQLFERGVPQIEVVDRLLGGRLGPAFRVGLGEDSRLLRAMQRLSAEQTEFLKRRGLLPKTRDRYPPEMVRIPAGQFWMGDTTREGWESERPRHEVEVSEFHIGKHPVTWRLWRDVRDWAVEHGYQFENPGKGRGDDHPVTNVNWYDAVKWCNARSEKEKRRPAYYTDAGRTEIYKQGQLDLPSEAVDWTADGYRLPTEAEWEKAARGGLDGHHYPWESWGNGNKQFISPKWANYDESQMGGTTSVDRYQQNVFGLYDMAGNVWQWTWDWSERYWQSERPGRDPHDQASGMSRVSRGGSWKDSAKYLRCAFRFDWPPSDAYGYLGFRLAGGQADAGFAEIDEGGERRSRDETESESEPTEESTARSSCLTVELLPSGSRAPNASSDPVAEEASTSPRISLRVQGPSDELAREIPVGEPTLVQPGVCRISATRRFCWPVSTSQELEAGKAYRLQILMQRQPPPGMVEIPAGPFLMGDPTEEGDSEERPQHRVQVSAFFIAKHQVTLARWREVYKWAIRNGYHFENQGSGFGDDHPVHTVSWYDVVKWCNALSQRENRAPAYFTDRIGGTPYKKGNVELSAVAVDWHGEGYRLPTEAEWEKAARGGLEGHHYPWASQGAEHTRFVDPTKAQYSASSGATAPVGSFPPNGYGLYDVAGNLWEWCWDWFDIEWYRISGATDPDSRGPDSGGVRVYRVYRGGYWADSARELRCACRDRWLPSGADDYRGFRLAGGQVEAELAEFDEGAERGSRDETASEPPTLP